MRAVLDNNILVSYLLAHRPPISEIVDVHLAKSDFILVLSLFQLEELDRVLQYPKLQRYYDQETRLRFIALVAALSEIVDLPETVPPICRDPADDWIIASAVAGDADVIVSGDRDLLDLEQVGKILILSAVNFLTKLQEEPARKD
jgi:putative PIN family toxin of toxin-antitoxin system